MLGRQFLMEKAEKKKFYMHGEWVMGQFNVVYRDQVGVVDRQVNCYDFRKRARGVFEFAYTEFAWLKRTYERKR